MKRPILSMYKVPPKNEISLQDFQKLPYKRLQILKKIEKLRVEMKRIKDIAPIIFSMAKELELVNPSKDSQSHFILRLVYCKTESLRQWFQNQETFLFRCRFRTMEEIFPDGIGCFLDKYKLKYEKKKISEYDKNIQLALDKLHRGYRNIVFKVRFQECLSLVKNRKVIIRKGFAYIPSFFFLEVISSEFRAYLNQQLILTSQTYQNILGDKRIKNIIMNLDKIDTGSVFRPSKSGTIAGVQVPALAPVSFPLCMQRLYRQLKIKGHLKHGGRMQLGLFLKGIGVSMEDSLRLWQQHFSPRTSSNAFQQEYAYRIRHSYGQEGKRTNYIPYGCSKILRMMPRAGEFNGCPFRLGENHLRAILIREKISRGDINEIIALTKKQQFQLACRSHFRFKHDGFVDESVGTHPNNFFNASRKRRKITHPDSVR